MAMKRRNPVDPEAIEKFASQAEAPKPERVVATVEQAQSFTPMSATQHVGEWPSGVPKTTIIRWETPDMPAQIAAIAKREERNIRTVIFRVIQSGLDAYNKQPEQES